MFKIILGFKMLHKINKVVKNKYEELYMSCFPGSSVIISHKLHNCYPRKLFIHVIHL